jgi:Domain of unknown function (DUF2382)
VRSIPTAEGDGAVNELDTRPRGRARLKKYVVTDYVEKKVPVKREEVRLEYEPADEPGERTDDPQH